MSGDRFFSGSALSAVDVAGRVRLPAFVQDVMIGRSGCRRLVLGVHETAQCLIGFEPAFAASMIAELERRRLADEVAAAPADAHHLRVRRAFGLAEEGQFDGDGAIQLPDLARRIGRIADLALFVGAGRTFEIWDPSLAREQGGDDLRTLAEYRLEARAAWQDDGWETGK
jgi:MraZ protein